MPESEPSPPSRRRAERVERSERRARVRRIAAVAGGALVVLAATAATLVFTGALEVDRSSTTVRAASAGSDDPPTTSTSTPRPGPTSRRPLTPDDPLRLWIAGDSLAGSVGPSLGELTANTGVVQPQYDSRVSSGLLNPNFFDWQEHAEEQLADLDPEVVVFVIGTNDANVWNDSLENAYRIRTEVLMRILAGEKDREVLWVGPPVAKADDLEDGVLAVATIQREAAQKVPGVTYVDAHLLFDDEHGEYQYRFANLDGDIEIMRAGDGVHFSAAGADYLGEVLYNLLDPVWKLTKQSVPGAAKRVRETDGSTQIAGTHRSVNTETGSTSSTTRSVTPSTTTASSSSTSSSTTTSTTVATTTTSTSAPPGP